MSRYQLRLGGFLALSMALHLLTLLGAGPLDLSARHVGAAPGRAELHATLVPGKSPQGKPVSSPTTEGEAGLSKDNAPEITAGEGAPRAGPAADDGGLALPAGEKWYDAREVDVRAEPLTEIRLRYPEHLRAHPVLGKVRIRLFIDERGVVRKIQIAESQPPGLFDESAKQIWEDVRFSPALKNGAPVKSQKLLELTYEPVMI